MSQTEKRKPRFISWLTYAVILTTLISTTTLSRYMATLSGKGTLEIAAVALETRNIQFETSGLKPGGTATYNFAVTNMKNGTLSDVTQDYTITVTDMGNLPLGYTLTENTATNDGTKILPQEVTKGIPLRGGVLPHSKETTHTYTLTVSWNSQENTSELANEIDLITVIIDSEQANNY